MSEQESKTREIQPPAKKGGRRKFFGGLALGGLLGALAATSFNVWSQAQGDPEGPGHSRGCWGHKRSAMTPEERAARADFATQWVLSRVDATEEQKRRVQAIVQDAIKDLSQVREQHMKNRRAFMDALSQPTVDRAALQQLRQSEMQLAESASERFVTAIADAADVLTPEQRGKLVEMANQFRRW
ncbi:MAG TPA: Spy/CpxP family protein refolding chaperone [Burkholderiales bacterium]|nr:Spy/CpxP family protein refolding chaperone [Burkholderiales bacterium]